MCVRVRTCIVYDSDSWSNCVKASSPARHYPFAILRADWTLFVCSFAIRMAETQFFYMCQSTKSKKKLITGTCTLLLSATTSVKLNFENLLKLWHSHVQMYRFHILCMVVLLPASKARIWRWISNLWAKRIYGVTWWWWIFKNFKDE